MNDKVSVIMPVYNGEKFIRKAINSVLNQTYDDLELIIINDGSTDNTEEIVHDYLKTDNRIIYTKQKNQGQSSARNKGLELSNGKYIQFLDCDDYLEKNALEILVNEINKDEKISFVLYGFNIWFNDELLRTPHLSNFSYDFTYGFKFFLQIDKLLASPCNKLYRKSYIKRKFNCSCVFGEDRIFNYENLDKFTSISCIENCLYNVVLSANQNSVNKRYRYGKIRDLILGIKTMDDKLRALFGDKFDEINFMKKELSSLAVVVEQCVNNRQRRESIKELKETREDTYIETMFKYKPSMSLHEKITIFLFEKRTINTLFIYCKVLGLLRRVNHVLTRRR